MAKPDLGAKRQCLNCGTKFFDLNKDPATCPKCGTVFQAATASAPARGARAAPADDDDTEEETGADVVPLEDADANDDGKVTATSTDDDDTDTEDDNASSDDDDTFLEEEEDDDGDVSGLIDGDIENDEER